MSATRCTCIRDGLEILFPDEDCQAAYIHITTTKDTREAEPA